jgi:hypothetical protein
VQSDLEQTRQQVGLLLLLGLGLFSGAEREWKREVMRGFFIWLF